MISLRYRQAVEAYASHQAASFKAAFQGDAAVLQAELARIENERHEILLLLSPDHHTKLVEKGLKRLSFNATIAALMIHLYASLGHSFERVLPKQHLFLQTMFATYCCQLLMPIFLRNFMGSDMRTVLSFHCPTIYLIR